MTYNVLSGTLSLYYYYYQHRELNPDT